MDKTNLDRSAIRPQPSFVLGLALAGVGVVFWILVCLSATAMAETAVVYRLKWLKNVSAAGGLFARDQGLFKTAGLSVTIKAGGPERDAIKELELGYAQFGVASADQVIRALAKNAPVVVIAQIFQINPLQWIYHDDEPVIDRMGMLKGRTIGITYGGNDETIMRTLLASAGLSEQTVRLFSVRYDYTPFFQRRVSLWPVYKNSQAIILEERLKASGKGLRYLEPVKFGVRFVANSIVTSRSMINEEPDMVSRFASALLSGWQAVLLPENGARAVMVLARYDRDTSPVIIEKQLAATRPLVQPDPTVAIGTIDVDAWRQTESILRDQHQIPTPVDVRRALIPAGSIKWSDSDQTP